MGLLRNRGNFVVFATHPDHPNYGGQMRGRKLHLSIRYERKTKTLCNMLVVDTVEENSHQADRDICLNCIEMAERSIKIQRDDTTYSFTINTDASLYRDHGGVAAWACWIKSKHYTIKSSGLLPHGIPNSSVAELLAVEQALLLLDNLISESEFLQGQKILLYFNTDSKFTVQALTGDIRRQTHRVIIDRVRSLTSHYVIRPRHVKGHTKGHEPREWVNNWCDRQAKAIARARLEELNGNTTEKV